MIWSNSVGTFAAIAADESIRAIAGIEKGCAFCEGRVSRTGGGFVTIGYGGAIATCGRGCFFGIISSFRILGIIDRIEFQANFVISALKYKSERFDSTISKDSNSGRAVIYHPP